MKNVCLTCLILLRLAAAVNRSLVGVTIKSFDFGAKTYLQRLSGEGLSFQTFELEKVDGVLPACSLHIPQQDSITLCSLSPAGAGSISVVSLETGGLIHQWDFPSVLIDNLAFDASTNTTFVGGFDLQNQLNHVYRLESNGTLSSIVALPKLIVESSIGSYCPVTYTMFLTIRDDDVESDMALIKVDLQHRKLLGDPVILVDLVTSLMWDSTTATMYAWIATEAYPAVLCTLDVATGKRLETIAQFKDLSPNCNSGAASVLDDTTGLVHASLISVTSPSAPVFVVVNISSGAIRRHARDTFVLDLAL